MQDLDVVYWQKDGRDLLRFFRRNTGETEVADITGKLADGTYQDTLKVLGSTGHVDLKVESAKSYGLEWPVDAEACATNS